MSRIEEIQEIYIPSQIDYDALARHQAQDNELQSLMRSKADNFTVISDLRTRQPITCDTSTGVARPYLPQPLRHEAFKTIHDISHAGIRATRNMISKRFYWPHMNTDIILGREVVFNANKLKFTSTPYHH